MRMKPVDYYLGIGGVVFLVFSVIFGVLVLETEESKETTISVEDVYFVMKEQTGETSIIEISVFVSNIGENDIEQLRIRAFSVETGSNLAKADASIMINGVPQKTTAEGKLSIEVPNRDHYRIELLIFREGRLDLRGSGTIDMTSIGAATDYRTYPGDGPSADQASTVVSMDNSLFPICSLIIALIAGIVIVVVLVLIFRKQKEPEPIRGFAPLPKPNEEKQPEMIVREGHQDDSSMEEDPSEEDRSLDDWVPPEGAGLPP